MEKEIDKTQPLVTKLNVPSGRLVVGRDFTREFRVIGDASASKFDGEGDFFFLRTLWYAERAGLAYGLVGSCGATAYQVNERRILFGRPVWDTEEIASLEVIETPENGKELGYTEYHYCVADFNEFVRRYEREPTKDDGFVVECEPGLYEVTYQHHLLKDEDYYAEKPLIYASIQWVGEPEPVVDYLAAYQAENRTAGEWMSEIFYFYPDLYYGIQTPSKVSFESLRMEDRRPDENPREANRRLGERIRQDSIERSQCYGENGKPLLLAAMKAADQMMCTQNGEKFHENGWYLYRPDLNIQKDLDIPKFNVEQVLSYSEHPERCYDFTWSTLGKESPIVMAAEGKIKLNESFVKLAFNVLGHMLRWPKTPYNYESYRTQLSRFSDEDLQRLWDKEQLFRLECFCKLAALYPTFVPQDLERFL